MSTETLTKRTRSHHNSAPNLLTKEPPRQSIKLQPYSKYPLGSWDLPPNSTASSPQSILEKHDKIDAQKYLVGQVGLENFIRNVVKPLKLQLPDSVKFNMNGCGRMQSWEDVYLAEQVYTRCLGISKRIYQTHSYTHEPNKRMVYFILEEHNERSTRILPAFDFYVLVFCYYDEAKNVTNVDVQYDQLSFFLHCMGVAQWHACVMEWVVTPVAICWAKAFRATGLVNPFTFFIQLMALPLALVYWFWWCR